MTNIHGATQSGRIETGRGDEVNATLLPPCLPGTQQTSKLAHKPRFPRRPRTPYRRMRDALGWLVKRFETKEIGDLEKYKQYRWFNMKVALYARVSMEETDSGNSRYQEPENQLAPLRQYAKDMGYEVVAEYVDKGSGADPSRPQYRQMIKDASQHKFGKILVWKMDRLSRESTGKVLSLFEQLKMYHIGVKSYTESYLDTSQDNPVSELLLAMMAWASAEERRKISERTKAGIQRLRNIGQYKGGRPKKKGGGSPEPSAVGTT